MLWSQIKLTSYDFSDVHIAGEFDNRTGTGRFLRIFSCVVTYRTGAVRHLYMKTSAGASVVKDQPDTVRCPADFTRTFHVQELIHLHQNSPLFLKRNRLLK